jgi:hypothetical protein
VRVIGRYGPRFGQCKDTIAAHLPPGRLEAGHAVGGGRKPDQPPVSEPSDAKQRLRSGRHARSARRSAGPVILVRGFTGVTRMVVGERLCELQLPSRTAPAWAKRSDRQSCPPGGLPAAVGMPLVYRDPLPRSARRATAAIRPRLISVCPRAPASGRGRVSRLHEALQPAIELVDPLQHGR